MEDEGYLVHSCKILNIDWHGKGSRITSPPFKAKSGRAVLGEQVRLGV